MYVDIIVCNKALDLTTLGTGSPLNLNIRIVCSTRHAHAYLVDVSLRVGEVSNESPGAEKSPEDTEADDVRARMVSRGSVEVGVILEALAVVRFRKWPLALLFPTLAPRRTWRDLVEVGHGWVCAGSGNQFDGHGKVAVK